MLIILYNGIWCDWCEDGIAYLVLDAFTKADETTNDDAPSGEVSVVSALAHLRINYQDQDAKPN